MAIPNQLGDNDGKDTPREGEGRDNLVSWIVPKLKRARDVRNERYRARWREYTRLWRGFWSESDRNHNSERSKLIAPALQQAVEMTVAEMEEAVFGRTAWFDIQDDMNDEIKEDAIQYRDQLLEDFELAGIPDAVSKTFLLGAIYGTGILKMNVAKRVVRTIQEGQTISENRVMVIAEAVRPDEFLVDPTALNVEDAQFVAHEIWKPIHTIEARIRDGIYRNVPVKPWSGEKGDPYGTNRWNRQDSRDDGAKITEYFGKVPMRFLPGSKNDGGGMTEAVVTVLNDTFILRAVESPFTNRDRPMVAYQHDTVPGEFHGRGVCEKGYNPQKALDSELRARIDALALTTSPMLGADMTRLPRNPDLRVRPGKVLFTRGRPSEILEQVGYSPAGLALTFQQSGDLERMVSMGTGAMDSATPLSTARRNETASGMSMMQSGFIKRSKRTMQNLERQFLGPLVRKALWRYMQFDPQRYPMDMEFKVRATMGIMAQEVENAQLVQMLGFTPPDSPAHGIILKALFDNTNSSEKEELSNAINAMLQPPTPEEQQLAQIQQQLAVETAQEELNKLRLQNAELQAKIQKLVAEAQNIATDTELMDDRVDIDAANAAINAQNARNKAAAVEAQRERNKSE